MRELVTSRRSVERLAHLRAFLEAQPADGDVVVLGPTWEAAAELVRSLGRPMFGWQRSTLFRFAAELARPSLLEEGLTLATPLSLEALWARVTWQLHEQGQLHRFEPVAERPGLARALGQTVSDVRLAGVDASRLEPGLAVAARAFEAALKEGRLVDRAEIFRRALRLADRLSLPALALLDVRVGPGVEAEFLAALAARAAKLVAAVPDADLASVARLAAALKVDAQVLEAKSTGALRALQTRLFSGAAVTSQEELTELFSAPGEARECVEIARRVLDAARTGVPFDRIAVLLRSPSTYRAPLEDAFRRARVPAWFARGVPRPDPSGRALLALLKCREDHLSARAFSEYLSLGQVPKDEQGAPPAAAPEEERFVRGEVDESLLPLDEKTPPPPPAAEESLDPDAPVTAGRLRAPRRWELLIIDAAVIGRPERWRKRLEGLRHRKEAEAAAPTATEAQAQRAKRELADLMALEAFALPLLDELAALPEEATWGEWIGKLTALATRALRYPRRVLGVLQELSPMGVVGPVSLREVRAVLTPRLTEMMEAPTARRSGQVFVAPVEAARGLSFDLVFVPGLAERIFPQKLREDPLLADEVRRALSPALETNVERLAAERLALQLAVGAASSRAVLSWPRIDAEHARPRVPSFYVLEAARAVEGRLPVYEELQRRAESQGRVRLAWPAPTEPLEAIDATEFDLATLDQVLHAKAPTRGRARYLVGANPHLARALRARYARWTQTGWTFADGLVKPKAAAREALAPHLIGARPFSPTALEHFAACPYKFFLSAVLRLSPLEIPGELEELGPLEKGSMAHKVQYRLLSQMQRDGLRLTPQTLDEAHRRLDAVLNRVAEETDDEFQPAIRRVWEDGVESLRADLREWLRRAAADAEWEPWRFELSFGLGAREEQDAHSSPEAVTLMEGLKLRGSIDLVEKSARGTLRATDYKTGKARAKEGNVIGGGKHLQPVLYALVLEKLFPDLKVEGGRLYYCTQAGGFLARDTPLDPLARESMGLVVRTIARALEEGFLPAAPEKDGCRFCDFRPVCGPDEERRVKKKLAREEMKPLALVRKQP
ncbi:MAG: PD-(D/E)XK nuclease family protein [Myxococcota bacterium]